MAIIYLRNDGSNDCARAAMIAKLTQVNALPCAEVEPAASDGNGERGSHKRTLGVGWHIVATLKRVLEIGLVLRHQMVENLVHIVAHVSVPVLVEAKSCRSVLQKQVQHPHFGKCPKLTHNLIGHQMATTSAGTKLKFLLSNHISKLKFV